MNKEFLKRVMWEAHYSLKAGTSASYIFAPYSRIEAIQDRKARQEATARMIADYQLKDKALLLPFRISFITGNDTAPVSNTGRGAKQKVAQLKAVFTKPEISPYKIAKPFKVCTSIWQVDGRKCFFYGTIGITPAEGHKPKDNGDLVIFHTSDWKDVGIYIFKGLWNPNEIANLQEAVEFVEEIAVI